MEQNGQVERIAEVMQNKEAADKLQACRNLEETIAVLGEYGVEMDSRELRNLCYQNEEGELTETNLDNIAGGGWLGNLFKRLFCWRKEKNDNDIHEMAQGLRKR